MKSDQHNITLIIKACKSGNRAAQKKLYQLNFTYGMSVALRYTATRSEAEDILNEAFLKVFTKIDQYDETREFKTWFRRILINSSIDYYRKYKKQETHSLDESVLLDTTANIAWNKLFYEDILKYIQLLPPSYRLVFNMYAIDGLKHQEIAEQLQISVGSSKSNYAKARYLLRGYLQKSADLNLFRHGR